MRIFTVAIIAASSMFVTSFAVWSATEPSANAATPKLAGGDELTSEGPDGDAKSDDGPNGGELLPWSGSNSVADGEADKPQPTSPVNRNLRPRSLSTSPEARFESFDLIQDASTGNWSFSIRIKLAEGHGAGPVYTEFYQTVEGQEYIVFRHEDTAYSGGGVFFTAFELESNIGFNADRKYRFQTIQNNGQRDIVLASGYVRLVGSAK